MSSRGWLLCALLLLQVADVVLTWRLLTARTDVAEANPLALAVLNRHGWAGGVALKLASTFVALGCAIAIGRKRPGVSRALLGGMCALLLGVVGYSTALLARPESSDIGLLHRARAQSAVLETQRLSLHELVRQRNAVAGDLLARRLTLPRAVERFTASLQELRGKINHLAQADWPRPDKPELVAAYLVRRCERSRRAGDLRIQLARFYPQQAGPAIEAEVRPALQ